LSSKPRQGASAALDEPFGATATAADEAAAKLGVRLPNASESQILRELALGIKIGVDILLQYGLIIRISLFSLMTSETHPALEKSSVRGVTKGVARL
jgi:hypothetical protein